METKLFENKLNPEDLKSIKGGGGDTLTGINEGSTSDILSTTQTKGCFAVSGKNDS